MPDTIRVKICGLRTRAQIDAARTAGADFIGLNFFAKSPRSVSIADAAALAAGAPTGLAKVALVVNPDNDMLDRLTQEVAIDILQLHGGETVDRVRDIKSRYGLPTMKVVGVADAKDLPNLDDHMRVADMILVDAKPPADAVLPGGNGLTFDWRLIAGRRWPVPWMLAGGLTPDNVAEAIRMTGATQVDVASGVESAPGVKDPAKMAQFVAAARA